MHSAAVFYFYGLLVFMLRRFLQSLEHKSSFCNKELKDLPIVFSFMAPCVPHVCKAQSVWYNCYFQRNFADCDDPAQIFIIYTIRSNFCLFFPFFVKIHFGSSAYRPVCVMLRSNESCNSTNLEIVHSSLQKPHGCFHLLQLVIWAGSKISKTDRNRSI